MSVYLLFSIKFYTILQNGATGFLKCPDGHLGHLPGNRQIGAAVLREIKEPRPSFREMGLPCFGTYYLLK